MESEKKMYKVVMPITLTNGKYTKLIFHNVEVENEQAVKTMADVRTWHEMIIMPEK